jgi:hypothetical protein
VRGAADPGDLLGGIPGDGLTLLCAARPDPLSATFTEPSMATKDSCPEVDLLVPALVQEIE